MTRSECPAEGPAIAASRATMLGCPASTTDKESVRRLQSAERNNRFQHVVAEKISVIEQKHRRASAFNELLQLFCGLQGAAVASPSPKRASHAPRTSPSAVLVRQLKTSNPVSG